MIKIKKRSVREYALYSSVISLGIILDQLTKWLAVKFIAPLEDRTVQIIPGIINFSYTENGGAAFGSFKDARWIFMVSSTVMILALGAYLYLGLTDSRLQQIAIALVLSGGLGNMIDRSGLGLGHLKYHVVDFIEFAFVDFAIFNVADSLVCIGAALLFVALVRQLIEEERAKKLAKESDSSDDEAKGE